MVSDTAASKRPVVTASSQYPATPCPASASENPRPTQVPKRLAQLPHQVLYQVLKLPEPEFTEPVDQALSMGSRFGASAHEDMREDGPYVLGRHILRLSKQRLGYVECSVCVGLREH